jgi:CrcB protein
MMFKQLLWLCSGASLGALGRYCIGIFFKSSTFPIATIVVNSLGCFIIGYVWQQYSHSLTDEFRLFLIVGFLGAFTTFSAYGLDIVTLLNQNHIKSTLLYIFLNNSGGIGSLYGGIIVAKLIHN